MRRGGTRSSTTRISDGRCDTTRILTDGIRRRISRTTYTTTAATCTGISGKCERCGVRSGAARRFGPGIGGWVRGHDLEFAGRRERPQHHEYDRHRRRNPIIGLLKMAQRFVVTVGTHRGRRYLAATGYTDRATHAAFYPDRDQAEFMAQRIRDAAPLRDVVVEPFGDRRSGDAA